MMHTLNQDLIILRSALRRMFTSPVAGILNILVIGIALCLPAGMYVLLQNAQGLIAQLSTTPQISLFMELDSTPEDIDRLRNRLQQHHGITSLEFIPKNVALEQLKKSTGLNDVIEGLENNPLPDAYIISSSLSNAETLEEMRQQLQKFPKVQHAQLDSAWAYKLEALLDFAHLIVMILACLLSFALIAVTFNTIRLQILTQRDEIKIARLIGATDGFIRRPFLYFGALQGLFGGAAAWAIINISLMLLSKPIATLSQLYASNFGLHSLTLSESFILLLFSVYLGWLGAWLSVTRHLSRFDPC